VLTEQEDRATKLLTKHRRGLELIAEALLEKETIEGREVAQLIQQGLAESGDGDGSPLELNISHPEHENAPATQIAPVTRSTPPSA
jgi:hypothetical protein